MSYKIEITAATTAELAGKLLALAAQMSDAPAPADPVMPEVKEAAKPKRAAKKTEEAAEQPVGEPSAIEATQASSVPDTTPESASPTSDSGPTATETVCPSEPVAKLDFDKDVTPVVLAAVKDKGREWVSGVLSQFGVERASQVPEERFPELVAMLKGDA